MLDSIFSAAGALAMVGWAGLILLPSQRWFVEVVARVVIPLAIACVYVFLMATNYPSAPANAGFGSLAAVAALFSVPALLVAGWIHYLAFDLFVGSWEVSDARANGVHHLLVVPCLLVTLMAGPAGLALYLIVKYVGRALRTQAKEQTA